MSKRLIKEEQLDKYTTRRYYECSQEDFVAGLEEDKEAAGNEETRRYFERAIDEVKRMGRKPKPAEKRRDRKCLARFNAEEFELISQAIGEEEEFAAGLRELALEAARARLAADR